MHGQVSGRAADRSGLGRRVLSRSQTLQPSKNDWERVYLAATTQVDRLFALNYKLIGRLLAYADAAEASRGA